MPLQLGACGRSNAAQPPAAAKAAARTPPLPAVRVAQGAWPAAEPGARIDLAPARWIWLPCERTLASTFVLFRRELELEGEIASARGWVSADSRYRLFVNGRRVQWGPAPCDPRAYEADPIDLTRWLVPGPNVIGAEVLFYGHGEGTWPFGKPGFLFALRVEEASGRVSEVVSDVTCRVRLDRAHRPGQFKRWYLRALQEDFDARLRPEGWSEPGPVDAAWAAPQELEVSVGGVINLNKPEVFVGSMLGAVLVFLFSSLTIKAVGKAAYAIINNVRDQFRNNPGIMAGTAKPDYGRCVDIVTAGALREMVAPGLLAVLTPVAVGYSLRYLSPYGQIGAESVAALLMVGTIAGILMATVMNNGGGAWDNAKKYIESGAFTVEGKVMGKKSEAHKAAVVGDTVGDPFKDTAGPSLHVLIKLLSTITLVLALLFIM